MPCALDSDPDLIFIDTTNTPSSDVAGNFEGAPAPGSRSWFARWHGEIKRVLPHPPHATYNMEALLSGCGRQPLASGSSVTTNAPVVPLEQIGARRYYTPLGWIDKAEASDEERVHGPECGELTLSNTKEWIKAFSVLMVRWGVKSELMDEWTRKVDLEFGSTERRQMYVGWDYGWAVRG